MQPSLLIKLAIELSALLLLANCAVNPVTGRQNFVLMSESEELRTGRKADPEIKNEFGVYEHPALQQYVNALGRKLARQSHRSQLTYQFTVLDSPEINAFALPGGYVYITRGILAYLNSEAELAAVLGHEIGHVTARHSVQQYSAALAAGIGTAIVGVLVPELGSDAAQSVLDLIGNALLSGYGREHELEADRLGAEYLARTSYDPQAMIRVIGVLKNQELFDAEIARQEGRKPRSYHGLFATHPDNDTRLQQVVGEAKRFAQPKPIEGREAFLNHVNGMAFGDSPRQGTLRGADFYHADLGFAMRFPHNWRVANSPQKVTAINPGGDAAIELTLAEKPQGSPADFLRRHLKLGFGSEVQATTVNNLPAATATATRSGKPLKAGVLYLHNKAFIIKGLAASASSFNQNQSEMSAAITSFHAITEVERNLARPLVIKTLAAKKGMSYSELARNSPLGKNAESYLRLMNGAYPAGEPVAGQVLKIVE